MAMIYPDMSFRWMVILIVSDLSFLSIMVVGDVLVTRPIMSTIVLTTNDLISSIELKLKCGKGVDVLYPSNYWTRDVGVKNIS